MEDRQWAADLGRAKKGRRKCVQAGGLNFETFAISVAHFGTLDGGYLDRTTGKVG